MAATRLSMSKLRAWKLGVLAALTRPVCTPLINLSRLWSHPHRTTVSSPTSAQSDLHFGGCTSSGFVGTATGTATPVISRLRHCVSHPSVISAMQRVTAVAERYHTSSPVSCTGYRVAFAEGAPCGALIAASAVRNCALCCKSDQGGSSAYERKAGTDLVVTRHSCRRAVEGR